MIRGPDVSVGVPKADRPLVCGTRHGALEEQPSADVEMVRSIIAHRGKQYLPRHVRSWVRASQREHSHLNFFVLAHIGHD